MGRPKKAVSQCGAAKLSKAEIESRLEQEAALVAECTLEAPEWLCDEAKKEFNRIVTEMKAIDGIGPLLSNLDMAVLATYADAWVKYIEITNKIKQEGLMTRAGTASPAVAVQIKYSDVIFKCSSKIGLSISDRLKLVVPKKEVVKNEFDEFM